MQKAILKLLLILMIFNSNAQTYSLNSNENIAAKLNINSSSMWAVNGGIFQSAKDGIVIPHPGSYQLLVKDTENNLTNYEVMVVAEEITTNNPDTLNTIHVDVSAPEIILTWSNAIKNDNGYTVGKGSRVSWQARDSQLLKVLINGNKISNSDQVTGFSNGDKVFKIEASDYFENQSIKIENLTTDFQAPELIWKLLPPAKYLNNHWIAGDTATAQLTFVDPSGVKNYSYESEFFEIPESALEVKNNSFITSTDKLGNSGNTNIKWSLDNNRPIVKITYQNKQYDSIKRLKVKKNQDFIISVEDDGIGLKNASFLNKKHRWEPLPKTFTPLARGHYKIRIRAEDLFGNMLKTKIYIRVGR